MVAFDWRYAKEHAAKQAALPAVLRVPAPDAFIFSAALRYGAIFRCKTCKHPWHLNGEGNLMTAITEDRVLLIQAWNERPIFLSSELIEKLEGIGATPPDIYGNGAGRRQWPCGVLTRAGERIDLALVTIQRDGPFEPGHYRLGSDIADIYASPLALPLDVRLASSRAQEAGQGFAPTLIEMPDGQVFVLNWQPNFMIKSGYRAIDARLSTARRRPDYGANIIQAPDAIVHFVVDPGACPEIRLTPPPPQTPPAH